MSLLKASEGVQAPVLQRSIADARVAGASTNLDLLRLQNLLSSMGIIEGAFSNTKSGSDTTFAQLEGMTNLVNGQVGQASVCSAQWSQIKVILDASTPQASVSNVQWRPLTAPQRDILARMFVAIRREISAAFGALGMGSTQAAPDFDAPVYYSLQELCDFFLPNRIQMEQANDSKIAGYVATLQMRLSRLLADGRYDFITRIEKHEDPLGTYLKALLGADPTKDNAASDWPAKPHHQAQSATHGDGPSVTIFDLSLVANDVLENVTALLGRILFDFAVRSQPRAEHPVMLVLEEAHRFIPSRPDSNGGANRSAAIFERIAKEGRKFGLSLLLASQRPSELSETVVAQCGTVIAHRLTHEADQRLLRHATALSSRTLLEQLPSLAQQHALVTGVSTGVPVAVRVRDVQNPPKSDDPKFIDIWSDAQKLATLPDHIDTVVREWQGALP